MAKYKKGKNRILYGAKIKLHAKGPQAVQLDIWRRRCRSLWNLLLSFEKAAYSGEKVRPELKWRQKWLEVYTKNLPSTIEAYTKARVLEKIDLNIAAKACLAGIRQHKAARANLDSLIAANAVEDADRDAYKAVRLEWQKCKRAFAAAARKYRKGLTIPHPQDDFPARAKAILGRTRNPKLFMWDDELLKVMALLKKEPLTKWINDIHSHATQRVCRDLAGALRAMLREKAKPNGLNIGFPVRKKATYADGSIYFANTQLEIDFKRRRIRFPGGIGEIKTGKELGNQRNNNKLLGARVFREGKVWWIATQHEGDADKTLPKTGRECGVKLAAKAVFTIYDGERFEQIFSRQEMRREQRRRKLAARRMERREYRSHRYDREAHRVAQYYGVDRNRRNDLIHKGTRRIVNSFDKITVDKMRVADMMEKGHKTLRKINQGAAMSRAALTLKYKSEFGKREHAETHVLFPSTQICRKCGAINEDMKQGKRFIVCCNCGNKEQRQKNSSANIFDQGEQNKKASILLAEV